MKGIVVKRNDAQCLIIGSGPEDSDLKRLARSLSIEGSIIFLSSTYKDIPLYLYLMDVFVLPSVEEGLGIALLEALASARACVASDTGGIRDIIKNNINGLLVPVGNTAAIENAILNLLDNRALGEGMGQRGRDLVKNKFSLTLMAEKVRALYERVLNEKH